MLLMQEWMELVNYKITDCGDYGWDCYGPNSHSFSSWNGIHGKGGYNMDIVFSTRTQRVYEVTVSDYTNDRAYRMINPDYVKKHNKEAKSRNVLANQAWDNVDYTELEVDDDFIQKCLAIREGNSYSTDISVQLDMSYEEQFGYMKLAHEANLTLNEYINRALRELVDKLNKDTDPKV